MYTYFQIADFGLSKKLADDTEYYVTSGGKVPVVWTAPEVCTVTLFTSVCKVVYYASAFVFKGSDNSHTLLHGSQLNMTFLNIV